MNEDIVPESVVAVHPPTQSVEESFPSYPVSKEQAKTPEEIIESLFITDAVSNGLLSPEQLEVQHTLIASIKEAISKGIRALGSEGVNKDLVQLLQTSDSFFSSIPEKVGKDSIGFNDCWSELETLQKRLNSLQEIQLGLSANDKVLNGYVLKHAFPDLQYDDIILMDPNYKDILGRKKRSFRIRFPGAKSRLQKTLAGRSQTEISALTQRISDELKKAEELAEKIPVVKQSELSPALLASTHGLELLVKQTGAEVPALQGLFVKLKNRIQELVKENTEAELQKLTLHLEEILSGSDKLTIVTSLVIKIFTESELRDVSPSISTELVRNVNAVLYRHNWEFSEISSLTGIRAYIKRRYTEKKSNEVSSQESGKTDAAKDRREALLALREFGKEQASIFIAVYDELWAKMAAAGLQKIDWTPRDIRKIVFKNDLKINNNALKLTEWFRSQVQRHNELVTFFSENSLLEKQDVEAGLFLFNLLKPSNSTYKPEGKLKVDIRTPLTSLRVVCSSRTDYTMLVESVIESEDVKVQHVGVSYNSLTQITVGEKTYHVPMTIIDDSSQGEGIENQTEVTIKHEDAHKKIQFDTQYDAGFSTRSAENLAAERLVVYKDIQWKTDSELKGNVSKQLNNIIDNWRGRLITDMNDGIKKQRDEFQAYLESGDDLDLAVRYLTIEGARFLPKDDAILTTDLSQLRVDGSGIYEYVGDPDFQRRQLEAIKKNAPSEYQQALSNQLYSDIETIKNDYRNNLKLNAQRVRSLLQAFEGDPRQAEKCAILLRFLSMEEVGFIWN